MSPFSARSHGPDSDDEAEEPGGGYQVRILRRDGFGGTHGFEPSSFEDRPADESGIQPARVDESRVAMLVRPASDGLGERAGGAKDSGQIQVRQTQFHECLGQ